MPNAIELRTGGGRVLVTPASMIPAYRRSAFPPIDAMTRMFRDGDCVAQLRGKWGALGLGTDHQQHLTPANLRNIVEQAIADYRIALLWIPASSDAAIHVVVDDKPKAPPRPPALPGGAPAVVVAKPIETSTTLEKIDLALGRSFDLLGSRAAATEDLQRIVARLKDDEAARLRIASYFASMAVPGVGDAVAAPFLAQAFQVRGLDGVRAGLRIGAASFDTAHARTSEEIDAAATSYADAFAYLGGEVLVWLTTRLEAVRSRGGRNAPSLEAAAKSLLREVIDDPMSLAKIIKEEAKSYSSQVLDKYEAAAKKAKSEAEDALIAGVKDAVTDVAGEAAGDAAAALLEKARKAADEELDKAVEEGKAIAAKEIQAAADKAEAVITSELEKAADEAQAIVTEEGLALLKRYLSDEQIATLERLAGEEVLSRLRAGKMGPEDLALYKQQLIAAARSEGEKAARDALRDAL